MRRTLPKLAWALLALTALGANNTWAEGAVRQATVALLSQANDPDQQARRLELRYLGHPAGPLVDAAKLAIDDSARRLQRSGWSLQLHSEAVANASEVAPTLRKLQQQGVRHVLLDWPADWVAQAAQVAPKELLLFNVGSRADKLRGKACGAQLFHTLPSEAMRADALAQYLAARNWRRALVLQGPLPDDAALDAAWTRAAQRYGIKTTAHKNFKLSGNPAERDLANPRLLTNDRDHDVIVVLDSDGEFARSLPYASQWARPVVGSNGLVASAWHAQWPRNGGPQLSRRFHTQSGRDMVSQDWAAWLAVKTVAELLREHGDASPAQQAKHLREDFSVAGYKGPNLSYRAWNGQLRQPMVLAHADGVVGTAPVEGVLHPKENMDTLGIDAPENQCQRQP